MSAAAGVGARANLVLDPVLTMNASGVIQSASDAVERVFGWTPEELAGRGVDTLIPGPPRSALERYLERLRRTGSGRSERSRRFSAKRKDGTSIRIELSVSCADLPVSAAPCYIGIVRDVRATNRGGGDDRARMRQLIAEQARALVSANLRLQHIDRLATLGTLAAGLGHEINNVLLPIRARLNALEHGGLPPVALDHVRDLRRSIAYFQHLSDAMHVLAVNPAGGVSVGEGVTSLPRWWGQVGTLVQSVVPRHVSVSATFPVSLPAIEIAPHLLTQVVLDLAVIAGKAIPERSRDGLVRIAAAPAADGRTLRLSVSDNGRVDRRGARSGRGPSMVPEVGTPAGAELEYEFEPGRGATAVLVVPIAVNGAARAPKPPASRMTATVTVRDERLMVAVAQLLVGAGVRLKERDSRRPGPADLWIAEAATTTPSTVARWRSGQPGRAVILLGSPPKRSLNRWGPVGATIIEPPDNFGALRRSLIEAVKPVKTDGRGNT